ncbi:MAG TPA: GNAT family N-acetyltransferase [Planctomycetota bacterium]|nr:GNAT family N-acetyltransferase [Planctomycetota bacterium]
MSRRIETATAEHVAGIRAIYNEAIRTLSATFDTEEKSHEDRSRWLAERSERHPVIVALAGGAVVGWGSLAPFSDRPAWGRTVENAVYVADGHRGQGWGDAILAELMLRARAHGHHVVIARIVGGNSASMRLHARHGFELAGTLREVGWKFERWHDVVFMQAMVPSGG